jgi:Ca2+-binding RTX toxin-like protein
MAADAQSAAGLRGRMPTITGTSGHDTLTGTWDNDTIYGLEGDDIIDGGDAADYLHGGDGNDTIFAGGGTLDFPNFIWDGAGNDTVFGGADSDVIYGSAGNDSYDGGTGGSLEQDQVVYSTALAGIFVDMRLTTAQVRSLGDSDAAGIGVDSLVNVEAVYGSEFADTMYAGTAGVYGAGGNDTLYGSTGHDVLSGGAGNDFIDGGEGYDTMAFTGATSGVTVSLAIAGPQDTGEGIDTIVNVEAIHGSEFDDVLIGNDDNNKFFGGMGGNDQIFGGGGRDLIEVYFGSSLIDGGDGDDWVNAGEGDDVINGGAGNDELWGGGGNNLFRGGAGNDQLEGWGGIDTADYSAAVGSLMVNLLSGVATEPVGPGSNDYYEDQLNQIENVIGGNFNDTLFGDDWHNRLEGGLGDDSLGGWFGDDVLIGGEGNDILAGELGDDILTGGGGNDRFQDSSGGLAGDTITDLGLGDRIIITDATLANFTFSLTGNTLLYSGGFLTLNGINGTLVASAAASGGVQLTLIPDVANDFNGDGRSDIMFRHDNGAITNFLGTANGGILNNGDSVYTVVDNAWAMAGTGDFNGDGKDDVLWRNSNGAIFNFLGTANGGVTNNGDNSFLSLSASWTVSGIGDFNGDGRDDILFRDANGVIFDYLGTASGGFTANTSNLYTDIADAWHVSGVGDFNGDGRDDILFRNDNGAITNFLGTANGGILNNGDNIYTVVDNSWHIAGTGDFNGDGRDDILWRNDNGAVFTFLSTANGGVINNGDNSYAAMSNVWHVEAIGDYNGDGRDDILWRHDNGTVIDWLGTASGGFTDNSGNLFTSIALQWQVAPADALI